MSKPNLTDQPQDIFKMIASNMSDRDQTSFGAVSHATRIDMGSHFEDRLRIQRVHWSLLMGEALQSSNSFDRSSTNAYFANKRLLEEIGVTELGQDGLTKEESEAWRAAVHSLDIDMSQEEESPTLPDGVAFPMWSEISELDPSDASSSSSSTTGPHRKNRIYSARKLADEESMFEENEPLDLENDSYTADQKRIRDIQQLFWSQLSHHGNVKLRWISSEAIRKELTSGSKGVYSLTSIALIESSFTDVLKVFATDPRREIVDANQRNIGELALARYLLSEASENGEGPDRPVERYRKTKDLLLVSLALRALGQRMRFNYIMKGGLLPVASLFELDLKVCYYPALMVAIINSGYDLRQPFTTLTKVTHRKDDTLYNRFIDSFQAEMYSEVSGYDSDGERLTTPIDPKIYITVAIFLNSLSEQDFKEALKKTHLIGTFRMMINSIHCDSDDEDRYDDDGEVTSSTQAICYHPSQWHNLRGEERYRHVANLFLRIQDRIDYLEYPLFIKGRELLSHPIQWTLNFEAYDDDIFELDDLDID